MGVLARSSLHLRDIWRLLGSLGLWLTAVCEGTCFVSTVQVKFVNTGELGTSQQYLEQCRKVGWDQVSFCLNGPLTIGTEFVAFRLNNPGSTCGLLLQTAMKSFLRLWETTSNR